jgi:hypothetical protein
MSHIGRRAFIREIFLEKPLLNSIPAYRRVVIQFVVPKPRHVFPEDGWDTDEPLPELDDFGDEAERIAIREEDVMMRVGGCWQKGSHGTYRDGKFYAD